MEEQNFDYIIIGAGLSGMVVKHFLNNPNTLLLDPGPGGYKIGESIIPEHFRHPEMRKQLYRISRLPSFTPKYGSTFIADGSVASFPLPEGESVMAMHILRSELEQDMMDDWNLEVRKERVIEVDLENHMVITDKSRYMFTNQVIDCSGPAMVIARQKKRVKELWPVHATWRYYDVLEDNPQVFQDSIKKNNWDWKRYDVFHRRLLDAEEIRGWMPSRSTILTKVRENVWTWQIPLYKGKILSFGVVSKDKVILQEELDELVREAKAPNYVRLSPRPLDKSSALNRLHMRRNFAKIADIPPADETYILVSDAYAFADPIYSVGTGLAVNKAIEVATLLNQGDWNSETVDAYNKRYKEQLDRAITGFNFWYDGVMMKDDEAAAEVQEHLLVGNIFQSTVGTHYADALLDAGLTPALRAGIEDKFFVDWVLPPLTDDVKTIIDTENNKATKDWCFCGAFPAVGGVVTRWRHPKLPDLAILVSKDEEGLKLAYMSYFEKNFSITDQALSDLMKLFRKSFLNNASQWRKIFDKISS